MILGRHPALWIAVIQAALVFASNEWLHWSEAQIGGLIAVLVLVGDVVVAGFTKDTVLGAIVGIVKAGLAAVALFGFDISVDTAANGIALVTVIVALLQMNATSPIAKFSLAPLPAPSSA